MVDAAVRTIAKLGGKFLLNSSPVRWTFREGVAPVEEQFDLEPEDAEELGRSATPITLEYTVNDREVKVENLWVMEVRPGPNPFIKRVRVADRRWFLKYSIVDRDYNVRRNIGFQRAGSNATLELNPVKPQVWYKPWSLEKVDGNPESDKWTPKSMLKDVIVAAQQAEKDYGKSSVPDPIFTPEIDATNREIPVESVGVHEDGDSAVDRALKQIPEAALYIDEKGNFIVFSRVSGKEKALVELVVPGLVTSGHVELVANRLTRPKRCRIYFQIEAEVRHDALEPADGATVVELTNERQLENVLPNPDFQLTESDGVPAVDAPIVQGTWLAFQRALAYFGTPPGIGGTQLTYKTIRKAFVPFLDLWAALRITGDRDPDEDWSARIGAIQAHFRQTYRINPRWVDKSLTIRARRVGIIHVATGTSAPAEAYMDYFRLGTQRSFFKNLNAGQALEYGGNVLGYPGGEVINGVNSFDANSKPVPAVVSIEDEDQGIVRVQLQPDSLRMYNMLLPSKLSREDGSDFQPCGNPRDRNRPIAFDSVTTPGQVPLLDAEHKMAIIISHVPASPNDERKLFFIDVEPQDVKDLLPAAARRGLGDAQGPIYHARVSGGLEGVRALVRWSDSRFADIEKIFGVQDGEPNLEGLVVNKEASNAGENKAISLNSVAKAVAAKIYAGFADHFEGEAATILNPDIRPDGWIGEVTHEISTRGVGSTTIRLPDKGVDIPVETLLDSSTRQIIYRQPQKP